MLYTDKHRHEPCLRHLHLQDLEHTLEEPGAASALIAEMGSSFRIAMAALMRALTSKSLPSAGAYNIAFPPLAAGFLVAADFWRQQSSWQLPAS